MRIRVSHPGVSPVPCELAAALGALGHDVAYDTTILYRPSRWHPLLAALPAGLRHRLERELRRRRRPGLESLHTTTQPGLEWLCVVAGRLGLGADAAYRLMMARNRAFDARAARLIRAGRPDLAVTHDYGSVRALAAARAVGALAVLNQEIGHLAAGERLMREEAGLCPDFAASLGARAPAAQIELTRRAAAAADHILVPSAYVRETYVAEGADPARISLLPYGVDTDRFRPPAERPKRPFRILFVGHVGQRKGIKYLLEAMRRLALPGAELVLVGKLVGPIEALTPYAGLFRQVPHVPHHEVHRLYQQADLYVFPSLHEGSSLTTYEALASGLPVVTTFNAGSVVRDGSDGYIVPIRDIEALMDRILRLYRDPELRLTMGRNARTRAEAYSWAAYGKRIAGWLDRISADRARSGRSDRPETAP